ncbi:sensor histidine kinase [Jidongwangia harbinensis]|uniref:sensor histidine kinase n=1 Tax=Jidongwangia harbinensis TaxID=2878561 RepID=UPI001CD91FAA|nr:sensor histidine kinase [Jidongwangia harbinensis]MCA2216188.1 sensor histidine kinase [Jidongwangia harbinensis]
MTAPATSRVAWHLVSGGLLAAATGATLILILLAWIAAILSLIEGPTGAPILVWIYAGTVPVGPFALLWAAGTFAVRQRARFRRTLGVDIPAPAPPRVRGWWRLVEPWRTAGTWRRLLFHLYAVAVDVPGTLLVVAPPAARRLARLDVRLARALLGPGRAEQLAERVETLARSRAEVIAATDAERRRIERDLHDGTQQRLVSLAMNLGLARRSLPPSPERSAIEAAHDEAVAALTELREFVRGLHPAVLDERGLDAAISGIAARAPLSVRVLVDVTPRCPPPIEAIAYFTVSEALTNVAKHASATRAAVVLRRADDRLRIEVTDDGRGGAVADADGGLAGLAHRAAAVDGTMSVHSPAGGPTTVTVELPCG